MIYGLNFGAPDIPNHIRAKFKSRIERKLPNGYRARFMLVGTCTSYQEMYQMNMQADNGHRELYWISRQTRSTGLIHAVYAH